MIVVGGESVPAVLGQIEVVATGSGFVFPTPGNPNLPVLSLNLTLTQSSPTAGVSTLAFTGLGGSTSLSLAPLFTDHLQFPLGALPPGVGFTHIVYTFSPFTIPNSNAVVNVDADISAVPEPASMLLLGSGAGTLLLLMRKRFSRR
jgi:hypothetical protein